jgi:hypothetical protein
LSNALKSTGAPTINRPMRKIRLVAIATALGLAALLVPGTAAARTITIGSELTGPTNLVVEFSGPSATVANAALAGPNPVAAPVDGRIVRWRLGSQPGSETYRLTVLHPTGLGTYVATATSDPELGSNAFSTVYPTALPIQAGDLIGLGISSGAPRAKLSVAEVAGATLLGFDPGLGVGSPATAPAATLSNNEAQFNADLAPAPRVSRVAPAAGPLAGGTAVTIFGRDFTQVGGVSFGSVPASSFTVLSENEIAATSPAGVRPGPFDVTVTSAIGTSPAEAADAFTYEPAPAAPPAPTPSPTPEPAPTCKVPSLTGKTLPQTRRLLRSSRCRLGAVRGHRRTGDKVIKQSPSPGLSRPSGWAVNVTID